jgi:uncharacterized membrane protein
LRIGLVAVGVVLAVLGVALTFVPIEPQPSATVSTSSGTPYYLGQVAGFSLSGRIPVAVSWSATGVVAVAAATCTSPCSNNSPVTDVTFGSGTGGSFTLNQPDGGYILLDAAPTSDNESANVTFHLTVALTTIGSILVVVGILVLILGVVLRGAAARPPAQSTTPGATGSASDAPSDGRAGGGARPPTPPPPD